MKKPEFIIDEAWGDMDDLEKQYWILRSRQRTLDDIVQMLLPRKSKRSSREFINKMFNNAKIVCK